MAVAVEATGRAWVANEVGRELTIWGVVRTDGQSLPKRPCILWIGVEICRNILSAYELKFKEVTLTVVIWIAMRGKKKNELISS